MTKERVVVAMSGGVDSSVAAYLLKEQGYDVVGITMQIWPDMEEEESKRVGGCCSLHAVNDARRVAQILDIPYYVMNFKEVFEKKVIDYFTNEYIKGKTPNPCIACNRYIKFEELLRRAFNLNATYLATGHYAIIEFDPQYNSYLLKKSINREKDQTYALYNLTRRQLPHILMPLGKYHKDRVREIAEKVGLPVARKRDSQEICFVKDDDYGSFVASRHPGKVKPGDFVDKEGNFLGKHKGIAHYTIGQRKGLGIALGKPVYVIDIIPKKNQVVLGDHDDVFHGSLIAEDINLIPFDTLDKPMKVTAKIRYSAPEAAAEISSIDKGTIKVTFDKPQRAITPGQAVVFYKNDIVIGGGTIKKINNYRD